MSRSTYIYEVRYRTHARAEFQTVGLFTVKHEAVSAISRTIGRSDYPHTQLWRRRDGELFGKAVQMEIDGTETKGAGE